VNEEGLNAARRLAGWELGDAIWAERIIRAYMDPEGTHAALDAENAPERTGVSYRW
jgi:hypothetical protein